MNELYALDPMAPAGARELKLILDQFGLRTGRFLAKFPDDWPSMLRDRLAHLPDVERALVVELLVQRKACLMPTPAPYSRSRPWPENTAEALLKQQAFESVIGQPENGFGWPTVEQMLYDDERALPAGVGAHVPMVASRYAECVSPLFQASAEVILVDSFFSLRTKWGKVDARRWPVLLALLQVAQRSGICQSLRLVLSRKTIDTTEGSESRLEQDLEALLAESKATNVELDYEVREHLSHGRYLFGIHGGLQFDQGFEELRGEKNHIHWLSQPELEPLLARFAVPTSLAVS